MDISRVPCASHEKASEVLWKRGRVILESNGARIRTCILSSPGEYGEIVIRTPPLLTSEMKIYQLSMALAWYNHLHSINFAKSKVKRTRKYRPEGVK
jgi:hypothetical protein